MPVELQNKENKMKERRDVKGIIPAVVMAYDDEGHVSTARLEKLYNYLVDNGIDALFIGGSTGEWPLLSSKERKLAAEVAMDCAGKKVPVVFHASSMLVEEARDYINFAERIGMDAVSIIMPYYFNFPQNGLYDYFATIFKDVNLPVYIYNIPGNVKNVLTPVLLDRLAEDFSCVAGVKDSSMDFLKLQEFMASRKKDSFKYFTGNDAQIVPASIWGATGAISAAAGAFPAYITKMYALAKQGKIESAIAMQNNVMEYRKMVVSNPPMSVVKAALEIQGFKVGNPRLPLVGLDMEKYKDLEKIMEKGGFLK